jgi:hypothetical protein
MVVIPRILCCTGISGRSSVDELYDGAWEVTGLLANGLNIVRGSFAGLGALV